MIRETLECVPQVESHVGHHSKPSGVVLAAEDKTTVEVVNCNCVFFIDVNAYLKQSRRKARDCDL